MEAALPDPTASHTLSRALMHSEGGKLWSTRSIRTLLCFTLLCQLRQELVLTKEPLLRLLPAPPVSFYHLFLKHTKKLLYGTAAMSQPVCVTESLAARCCQSIGRCNHHRGQSSLSSVAHPSTAVKLL